MSYANLVNQACSSNTEAFQRLRDFLCKRSGTYDYSTTGIGWTLHDAVYATDEDNVAAGDYFVAYSSGEDGGQDLYLKVTLASGYINIHLYLYWDASTHVGVSAASTANNWTATASTALTLWVYGDLDAVICIGKYGSIYYANLAGHCPDSEFATDVATSSAAVSAGSSVVVTVDAVPDGFAVGRKIYIRDTTNVEICTISAISGNDITLTTVVSSYTAGCKLQGEVSYFCQGSTQILSTWYALIGHNGTKSMTHAPEMTTPSPTTIDGLTEASPMLAIFEATTNSNIGPLPHIWLINSTGRTVEGTEGDTNGNTYRYFMLYSSKYLLVREV